MPENVVSRIRRTPSCATNPLHQRLLNAAGISPPSSLLPSEQSNFKSSSLSNSGYYILRHDNGIELAFDCAPPCPDELPPHAHADCLSIDLYYQGQPIIVDTGTSIYASGEIRSYERSTLAHNTIAIANQDQSEMWGSFRVGRKARPENIRSGQDMEWQWVSAAHNGYARPPLNAKHWRWVGLSSETIVIFDRLETAQQTNYTSSFHFAPGIELIYDRQTDEYSCQIAQTTFYLKFLGLTVEDRVQWLDANSSQSWYAPEFGLYIPRGKLLVQGALLPGNKNICLAIAREYRPKKLVFEQLGDRGKLYLNDDTTLDWCLNRDNVITKITRTVENIP